MNNKRLREKPSLNQMMTLEDFRFYCERQVSTDIAILAKGTKFYPTYRDRYNQLRQEIAEMTNELKESPKWWARNKIDDREKVLTEFVDAIHFYCGMVVEDFVRTRHLERASFERVTEKAYINLRNAYDSYTLEDSEMFCYAPLGEARRHFIGKAFDSFDKGLHNVLAAGFRIIATFEVTNVEVKNEYMDKNDIVHARNEGSY